MAGPVMDNRNLVLGNRITLGDSLLFRAVLKAANVYDVRSRDVPNWLDYHTFAAGACLFWMDHTCWPVNATVWVRPNATPNESKGYIALDTAKTDQGC